MATIALALSAPLMLGVALAIKRESRGPVIFRPKRIGFNGLIFEIWKSRSMHAEHPDPDASRQTSKDDQRGTQVGRVIRRSGIDDSPQLLNVKEGRMSVVGPRTPTLDTRGAGRRLEMLLEGYAGRRRRGKPGSPDGSDERLARRILSLSHGGGNRRG